MEPIKWREEWNLDYDGIDTQHKKLIDLINRIILKKSDLTSLVTAFIDYTSTHFADEEALMFRNKYPKDLYDAHRREHKEFTNILLEISFELSKNGNPKLARKFKEFCIAWFKYHFLGTDKTLVEFLKGGVNTDNEPNK